MDQQLIPLPPIPPPALTAADRARVQSYILDSKAVATRRAYNTDWKLFQAWCRAHEFSGIPPVDPQAIAAYLSELADAGQRPSTIQRKAAAIGYAHKLAKAENSCRAPEVTETLKGIRRRLKKAQNRVKALLIQDIRAMMAIIPNTIYGVRNRALMLIGFATACRRSELVALRVEDVEEDTEGLRILIRSSKTDQEGAGEWVGVTRGEHQFTCPVRAYNEWIAAAGITVGPIFRAIDHAGAVTGNGLSDRMVARIVKGLANDAGLDPKKYSGHSLRAGFVTASFRGGAREASIMKQTRHRRSETLQLYIRPESVLGEDNASRKLGL